MLIFLVNTKSNLITTSFRHLGNHTSDPSRHVSILTLWFSQGNQQLLCTCEYFVATCAWFIVPPDKDQRTGVYKMQFNNDHIYALNKFFHPSTQKFNNFGSSKKLNIYIIQMPVQIKQKGEEKTLPQIRWLLDRECS